MIYVDTNYLVRLYVDEPGSESVRSLARSNQLSCALHGRAELISAFHRRYREGEFNRRVFWDLLDQFLAEEPKAISWLEAGETIFASIEKTYRSAPASVFLRAADAMHLACAAENGFREIYSNDRHLLAAAPLFGLKARNVIEL